MAVKHIPEGYQAVTPYLVVQNASQLIDFLKRSFGAEEAGDRMTRPDGKVMHAEVRIGGAPIMLCEPMMNLQAAPASIYLYVEDVDAAYRRALEAGATSLMEPADQFYGDRSGGVKDSQGNIWWIGTHIEDVAPEELAKRAAAHQPAKHG
jgi:PhnB protein